MMYIRKIARHKDGDVYYSYYKVNNKDVVSFLKECLRGLEIEYSIEVVYLTEIAGNQIQRYTPK